MTNTPVESWEENPLHLSAQALFECSKRTQKLLARQREEMVTHAERVIQEERYSGVPFAVNKLIKIIKGENLTQQ